MLGREERARTVNMNREKEEFISRESFQAMKSAYSSPGPSLTGRKWGEMPSQAEVRMREASVGPATCPQMHQKKSQASVDSCPEHMLLGSS